MKLRSYGRDRWPDRWRCRGRRLGDRPRGHALVDLRRRGRGGRRIRQGVRRDRQQMGRRRHRRRRPHRAPDHDQPHHRRRPDGRDPVQPRPPGRGTGRGRPDARPDRRRRGRGAGRKRSAAPALLDSCTVDGKIYCVPINIHSWQWLWLSNKAFEDAGVPVPTNWDEFVAAAPEAARGRQDPARDGRPALAAPRRLQRA